MGSAKQPSRKEGRRMLKLALTISTLFAAFSGMPIGEEECCTEKVVGDNAYTLVGKMNTKAYKCLNDCIYKRKDGSGSKFCFAAGDEKVECQDEESGGTDKPKPTTQEGPGTEGPDVCPSCVGANRICCGTTCCNGGSCCNNGNSCCPTETTANITEIPDVCQSCV